MSEQFANHAGTTLAAAITVTTRPVTFSVASAVGLPSTGNFRVLIDSEILLVTAISGTSLTGFNTESTAAATHNSGVAVTHILTAGALQQLEADVQTGVPIWQKVSIPYTSLTTAGTSQAVNIVNLSARQAVAGLVIKHSAAFVAAGLTALTMTIGDSTATSGYYSANPYDVTAAVTNTTFSVVNTVNLASFAGSTVQANFSATGANLNTLSAGSVDIDICLITLP